VNEVSFKETTRHRAT